MTPRTSLSISPPYAVEKAIANFGTNLRKARLRRNLTVAQLAAKLGVGRHVVANAEGGKPTTSIGVYVGALWAMNLLHTLDAVANPKSDEEGLALASLDERERSRPGRGPSNDF